ncbi:MAG TPA: peptidoglycan editing factor PgeF [Candidatus Limnocylindria bacterium]|nr:peptidoglycan editing factor PgeF [Candidatus Limnocylindria bacterium]
MWTLERAPEPPVWFPATPIAGSRLCFTTRRGGVSVPPYDSLNLGRSSGDDLDAVEGNRRWILERIGLAPDALATVGQVHGGEVQRVDAPGHTPGCDALVTRTPVLALAVSAADCLPILYAAPGAVAAAHAGWRGLLAGIAEATLRELSDVAIVSPLRITAHLGPCIRSCCFQVGPEVARRFPAAFVTTRDGASYVDLPGVARRRLLDAGMSEAEIHDTGACTACEPHWYFSHRRDRGRTGRMWGLAARIH